MKQNQNKKKDSGRERMVREIKHWQITGSGGNYI